MWALRTQPVASGGTLAHGWGWHADGQAKLCFCRTDCTVWPCALHLHTEEGLETVANSRTPGQTSAAATHFIADAEGAE